MVAASGRKTIGRGGQEAGPEGCVQGVRYRILCEMDEG